MLVVDYTTASGSKQTAFWRESEARPRVWVNAESGSDTEGAKAEERAAEKEGESAEESLSFNEMLALYSTSTLEREDKAPDQGRPSTKMDDEAKGDRSYQTGQLHGLPRPNQLNRLSSRGL